jgi:hypothetical protein
MSGNTNAATRTKKQGLIEEATIGVASQRRRNMGNAGRKKLDHLIRSNDSWDVTGLKENPMCMDNHKGLKSIVVVRRQLKAKNNYVKESAHTLVLVASRVAICHALEHVIKHERNMFCPLSPKLAISQQQSPLQ